jgi:hypothetical protein
VSHGVTPFLDAYNEAIKKPIDNVFCQIVKDSPIDMSLPSHQKIFLLCCQSGRTNLVNAMIDKNVSLTDAIEADTSFVYKQCEALGRKAAVGAILGNDGLWYQQTMPGFTALDFAIIFNHVDVIKMLADKMRYHSLNELLTKPHLNGRASTLELAQAINHQEVVKYLQTTFEQKRSGYLGLRP